MKLHSGGTEWFRRCIVSWEGDFLPKPRPPEATPLDSQSAALASTLRAVSYAGKESVDEIAASISASKQF